MQFSRVALAEDGFGANTTTTIHPLPRSLPSFRRALCNCLRYFVASSPLLLLFSFSRPFDPSDAIPTSTYLENAPFGPTRNRPPRRPVRRSLVSWSERSGFNAASAERCRSSGAGK